MANRAVAAEQGRRPNNRVEAQANLLRQMFPVLGIQVDRRDSYNVVHNDQKTLLKILTDILPSWENTNFPEGELQLRIDYLKNAVLAEVIDIENSLVPNDLNQFALYDRVKTEFDKLFTNRLNKLIARLEARVAGPEDKKKKDEKIPDWEFRPSDRHDWEPQDYINHAWNQRSTPASEILLEGGASLRAEFNQFVKDCPKYKDKTKYWETAFNTATVLWKANPPTPDSFSVDIDAYFSKGLQEGGFDTTNVYDLLADKDYGEAIARILALIEMCLYDHGPDNFDKNYYYEATEDHKFDDGTVIIKGQSVVERGQFFARAMDLNQSNLNRAISVIVKEKKWLDKLPKKDKAKEYLVDKLVDHAFSLSNATDSRGHFFLNDTASAVTKGFGGVDYTWEVSPQFTIGYDRNRYGREPKASHYLLSVLGFPKAWHEQAAHNTFYSSKNSVKFNDDDVINIIRYEVKKVDDAARGFSTKQRQVIRKIGKHFAAEEKDGREAKIPKSLQSEILSEGIIEILEEKSKKARIKAGIKEEHLIREWFHNFLSEKDIDKALTEATQPDKRKFNYSIPFEKEKDADGKEKWVFKDKGATFPTIYQFYIGQLMKNNKFEDGQVVSVGLTKDIIEDQTQFEQWAKKNLKFYEEDENGKYNKVEFNKSKLAVLKMYLIARGGWTSVLDTIKLAPKDVDAKSLLKDFDNFLGNLGKSKIVPGAHHNMMNVISLLYLTKMFKYLKPRDYREFKRVRKQALEKVSNNDAASAGGGVPPQVKTYITWLLSDAKSSLRSAWIESNGDMLRPMDPSRKEIKDELVEERTLGLDPEEERVYLAIKKAEASAETFVAAVNKSEHHSEIPLGPIKWEEQGTSTKESKDK